MAKKNTISVGYQFDQATHQLKNLQSNSQKVLRFTTSDFKKSGPGWVGKAEADLKERQVKLLDIDLGKAQEEIVEVEDVKALLSEAVLNAKNLLLALPSKAAPSWRGCQCFWILRKP